MFKTVVVTDEDKKLLKIKCGILAIHLLIFFLFTIMSIFIFYDLSNEIIDMAINKDKEYIMGYVKTKLLLVYSLFAAINVIFLLNSISFLRKKKYIK